MFGNRELHSEPAGAISLGGSDQVLVIEDHFQGGGGRVARSVDAGDWPPLGACWYVVEMTERGPLTLRLWKSNWDSGD